jgi:hypothetical protein
MGAGGLCGMHHSYSESLTFFSFELKENFAMDAAK